MRKKTGRLTIKAFFIFFFAVLFLVLLCREEAAWKKKQPKGERITAKEVRVLCRELEAAGADYILPAIPDLEELLLE